MLPNSEFPQADTENPNGDRPTSGYDEILLIGQSNTIGRDSIRVGIDDDYSTISGRVFQWGYDAQALSAATNPLDHVDEYVDTTGFWLTFCNAIVGSQPANRDLLVVPCAQGGTSFAANNWNPGDPNYVGAQNSLAAAMATGSGTNVLKYVLWLQGESDADAGVAASNAYLTNIQAMYDDMILNYTGMTASTPFIVGSIKPDKTNATIINTALSTFATNNSAVEYVDLTDLTFFDPNHYDAASLATIGTRYAGAL